MTHISMTIHKDILTMLSVCQWNECQVLCVSIEGIVSMEKGGVQGQ